MQVQKQNGGQVIGPKMHAQQRSMIPVPQRQVPSLTEQTGGFLATDAIAPVVKELAQMEAQVFSQMVEQDREFEAELEIEIFEEWS